MKGRRRPARGEATEQAAGGEDVAVAVAKSRRRGWGDAVRAVSFVGLKQGGFCKLSLETTFIGRREYVLSKVLPLFLNISLYRDFTMNYIRSKMNESTF